MYSCAQIFIYQILPRKYTDHSLAKEAGNCIEPSVFLWYWKTPPDVNGDSWKRPLWWERLRAGGEGYDRRWVGWMASPTRWTWVWASSRSWWWTGRPGVLQPTGSQRVGHDWAADLPWVSLFWAPSLLCHSLINLYPVMCITSLEYSCYSPIKLLHILGVSQ